MKAADRLINDLRSTLDDYEKDRAEDRELEELHRVAAAAVSMLATIRDNQRGRFGGPNGNQLTG